MLFLKDTFPDVPIIGFFEYFYQLTGGMKGFDPNDKYTKWSPFFITARNAVGYASIQNVDLAHTPMVWQAERHPQSFRDKMYICHDGIRTDKLVPDPKAEVHIKDLNRTFTRKDEVFTYMARNLEPARGVSDVHAGLASDSGGAAKGRGSGDWRQ